MQSRSDASKCCGGLECAAIQTVLICACWCSDDRSEEHTSELQSLTNIICRLLLQNRHCINGEWCCARDASIICGGSVGDIMQSRSDASKCCGGLEDRKSVV